MHQPVEREVELIWEEVAKLRKSVDRDGLTDAQESAIRSYTLKWLSIPAVLLTLLGFAGGVFFEDAANKRAAERYEQHYRSLFDSLAENAANAVVDANSAKKRAEEASDETAAAAQRVADVEQALSGSAETIADNPAFREAVASQLERSIEGRLTRLESRAIQDGSTIALTTDPDGGLGKLVVPVTYFDGGSRNNDGGVRHLVVRREDPSAAKGPWHQEVGKKEEFKVVLRKARK